LYSGITENLLKCKLEVETALLSLQANSEDKLAVISKIVILLSKLQHQVATFSQDILTTDSTARTGNKLIGGSASLKERRRAVKVEINAKDFIEGNAATSNIEMAQLLENLQKEAQSSPVKSYIRLMLDVPTSSNFAYFYHILIVICILLSMVLLFWQTMVRSKLFLLSIIDLNLLRFYSFLMANLVNYVKPSCRFTAPINYPPH